MKAMLCLMVLLLAGCAAATDNSERWRTREGALADPLDFADCQKKARYTEPLASSRVVVSEVPVTDVTILEICMDAHGYRHRLF